MMYSNLYRHLYKYEFSKSSKFYPKFDKNCIYTGISTDICKIMMYSNLYYRYLYEYNFSYKAQRFKIYICTDICTAGFTS